MKVEGNVLPGQFFLGRQFQETPKKCAQAWQELGLDGDFSSRPRK